MCDVHFNTTKYRCGHTMVGPKDRPCGQGRPGPWSSIHPGLKHARSKFAVNVAKDDLLISDSSPSPRTRLLEGTQFATPRYQNSSFIPSFEYHSSLITIVSNHYEV
ncbi:predicted protein [Uncinocarpus reesii 1704]|uniref:Uncharacterized protein n=1 Tax=Uncinocarpus reesii (strain UAMH 1704) TaxID=336963 RepID=C4JPR8_UNCRE|nr:uncharacterized protein UREG_04561 [Uncinocarpus reesii 1704]EEP79715.1 predicted protein [Uncinocarpus reesii 1704]